MKGTQVWLNGRYRLEAPPRPGLETRAWDVLTAREVALRVASEPGPAEWDGGPAARVVHPLLARVVEAGRVVRLEGGPPDLLGLRFSVREELPGARTLSERAQEGLALPLLARVGLDALDALEALHDLGLEHGGLAPEALAVLPDGGARLLDLVDGRELPGREAYRPGEGSGAGRADLAGLGACLYAAVAGRLPDPRGPIPLRELRAEVPPALSRAVTALLLEDPRARSEAVPEARQLLASAAGLAAPPPTRPATLAPRFVDRADVLALIERTVEEAQALHAAARAARESVPPGGPPLLLVEGAPGLGKSRLLFEAAQRLARSGRQVLWGQGFAGGAPYASWRPILAQARERGAAGELGEVALGALSPDSPLRPHVRHDYVARYLLEVASRRPLVLLLDDAHLLDAPSAELLVHVARAAATPGAAGALALILSARPQGATPEPLRRALLEPLAPRYARVVLDELDPAGAEALARSLAPDPAGVARLVQLGGGNPFLLCELAGEDAGAAPASAQELVQARLARLDAPRRALLEGLAVLGRPAAPGTLTALVDAPEPDGALRALLDDGLVERDGGGRFRLRHGLTRAVLLDQLEQERLQELCRRALGALEPEAPLGERARLALTAQTDQAVTLALAAAEVDPSPEALYLGALELLPPGRERAGVQRRLAEHLRLRGEQAEARRALEAALEDLEEGGTALELAELHLLLGQVAVDAGDVREALERAAKGRGCLDDAGARGDEAAALLARLLAVEARVAANRSDHAAAARLLERAKQAAPAGQPLLRARLLIEEANALVLSLDRTRYPAAERAVEEALRTFRAERDAAGEVEALRVRGNYAYYSGDPASAEAGFREAIERAEALGDPTLLAGLYNNLGLVVRDRGDLPAAEAALERALDLAERAGLASVVCRALTNVGRVRRSRGDLRGAERSFRGAARVARQAGETIIASAALSELGQARLAGGRFRAALSALRRSRRVRLQLGDPGRVAESELELAELWRRAGDVEGALGCIARALALQAALGNAEALAIAIEAAEFTIGRPGGPAALLGLARRRLRPHGPPPVEAGLRRGAPVSRLVLQALAAWQTARAGDPEQGRLHLEAAQRSVPGLVANGLPAQVLAQARSLLLEAEAVALAAAGQTGAARSRLDEALGALEPQQTVRRGALRLRRAFLLLASDQEADALEDARQAGREARLPTPLQERRRVGLALVAARARRSGAATADVPSLAEASQLARRLGDVALLTLTASARAEAALLEGAHREAARDRAEARAAAERLVAGLPASLADGLLRALAPPAGEEPAPAGPSDPGGTLLALVTRVLQAGPEPERQLEVALEALLEACGARRGAILLLQEDGPLQPAARRGLGAAELEGPAEQAAARAVEEDQPALLSGPGGPGSALVVPLRSGARPLGACYLDQPLRRRFGPEQRELALAFCERVGEALGQAWQRAHRLGELTRLAEAYRETARELGAEQGPTRLIGSSPGMRVVHRLIERYGRTSAPVTIFGESGTGKELVARALHATSPRRGGPFIALNCSAVSESLLESELFGSMKGAFTGADRDRKGLFELAHRGTLFLDEVADMSLEMQAKLLRVLETGELRPVGGRQIVRVDVRIISATHRDLRVQVQEGSFREDLLYRLNVLRIELPPLRERREDLPVLVEHFLERIAAKRGEPRRSLTPAALEVLLRHPFPGNVRELENVLERACVLEPGAELGPERLLLDAVPASPEGADAPAYHKTFQFRGVALNRRQRQVLEHLAGGVAAVTNRDFCSLAGVSERTGLRDLTQLVEAGLLERLGKRKGARYQLRRE